MGPLRCHAVGHVRDAGGGGWSGFQPAPPPEKATARWTTPLLLGREDVWDVDRRMISPTPFPGVPTVARRQEDSREEVVNRVVGSPANGGVPHAQCKCPDGGNLEPCKIAAGT